MDIETKKYVRNPLYVDAVRVTEENFEDIAAWCQGTIEDQPKGPDTRKFIRVRVHQPRFPRQTQAFVGDWLLYTEKGYKVYSDYAFNSSFTLVDESNEPAVVSNEQLTEELANDSATVAIPGPIEAVKQHGLREAALASGHPVDPEEEPEIEATLERAPEVPTITPEAAAGKRVLTVAEQSTMNQDEIRELLQSGEVVLEQELPKEAQSA